MKYRVCWLLASLSALLLLTSCGMVRGPMAGMMGMGDKMSAMEAMEAVSNENGLDAQAIKAKRNQLEKASFASGQALFNGLALSKNGKSCASCHKGGGTSGGKAIPKGGSKSLAIPSLKGNIGSYPKYKTQFGSVVSLQQMVNYCVKSFQDGSSLNIKSKKSWDLILYIRHFENGEKVDVSMIDSTLGGTR